MAKFYIEEHDRLVKDVHSELVQSPSVPVAIQTPIDISGAAANSAVVQPQSKFLLISTDTACQFMVGAGAVADANSRFLPANGSRYVFCSEGDRVSVIAQQ